MVFSDKQNNFSKAPDSHYLYTFNELLLEWNKFDKS